MKIMKMNDEKMKLSLNLNIESKTKPQKTKDKNIKCANKIANKHLL